MNLPTEIYTTALTLLFTVFFNAVAYAVEVVVDLKLVQLIFRHGDRAPLHSYKTDPYPETIWTNGVGRLTKIGMEQQFEAGKFYRQRYSKFLDPTDGPNQVYIRSSDQDRTLQSAAVFSAGLFPPSTDTAWNEELGKSWRPVSVHSVPWEQENLLSKQAPCPAFFRLKNESSGLHEAKRLYKEYRAVFDFVANQSGAVIVDRKHAWETLTSVRDVVFCQHSNGKPFPPWLNQTVFDNMNYLAGIMFHLQSGGNEDVPRARLAGGNLLALVLQRMLDRVQNKAGDAENTTRAFIYSAHDSTVAGILSTLELYDFNGTTGAGMGIPKYTAAVLIELLKNDTVRISLKNDPMNIPSLEPQILQHPRCESPCPLDKLVQVTKDYAVQDWEKECQSGQFGDSIDVDDVTIALVTVVLVIILTTVALGCYKRQSHKKKSPLLSQEDRSRTDSSLSVTYSRLDQEDESV